MTEKISKRRNREKEITGIRVKTKRKESAKK
jgi:hypothetical protein